MYDGLWDLVDYLETIKTHIILHDYIEKIAWQAFSLTLKEIARNLFKTLNPGTIDSFKELAKQFLIQFIGSHKRTRPTTNLLSFKQ